MREEVRIWWKQAEADFESAKANFSIKKYYIVVFLCQQCIEKGLKACFIKLKKTNPGTTHSLIYLATEVSLPKNFFKFLRRTTPQFVNTRYPDAAYGIPSELYDEEIAEEYLKETGEVMKWLKLKIET